MQLKKSNIAAFTLCLFSLSTFASDMEILSKEKQSILEYNYKQSIEDSNKLKKDWINPVTYKYIYNNDETYSTQRSTLSISQPIFKSGGIYSAIKYADSVKKYSKISIDTQKKELIKQTIDLIFQIKQLKVNLKKQDLMVENAKLEVERKKEQVLNGILDTSFLDNAILDLNAKQNQIIDLEHQKTILINNLANLTDKKYDQIMIPELTLTIESTFINKNIYLKKANEDIASSYWMKNMTSARYLPTVNFTADYTKYHETDNKPSLAGDDSFSNIGFNITIPLDIKYSNNIESKKIDYIKKKLSLEEIKKEQINFHKTVLSKLKSIDKKIDIAKNDVELYDSLLTQMNEQLSVGMKTESDVKTMQNSKQMKALEIKSLKIDKQKELLSLYYRIENE